MTLPGLNQNGLAFVPLDLGAETYSDLVGSTLGNVGTSGDDLDLSAQLLGAMMADFENDVAATDAADTIPEVGKEILGTAVLDALLAEISVASATELAISDGFDFLAGTFAVWGVFTELTQFLDSIVNLLFDYIGMLAITTIGGLFDNPHGL